MTKQRFTSADVAGEAACLRTRVLGMRLANLYDIDAKVPTHLRTRNLRPVLVEMAHIQALALLQLSLLNSE